MWKFLRGFLGSLCACAVAACASISGLLAEPGGSWLAGDTHVHTDHSSDGSRPRQQSHQRLPGNLPVRDQIAEAERNHLDFLAITDHRTYDPHWDPQWTSSSRLLLIPGEEANGHPHAVILGATDEMIDGASPPDSAKFRHVQQALWDAHAQDAIWSVAHPDNGELASDGRPNDYASVLGIDTVEIWNPSANPDAQIDYAENRWNRGFRFGVVGASDNHYRELWSIAGPGKPVTWVFARERSQQGILEALRAGHTAVGQRVNGPFVTIEGDFDGDGTFEAMGGDEIIARAGTRARLRVRVRNGAGIHVYVYRAPGRAAGVAALFRPKTSAATFLVPITIAAGLSWYRVEARAPGELSGLKADASLPDQLRAASTPLFITTTSAAKPEPETPVPASSSRADEAQPAIEARSHFAGFADVSVVNDTAHVVAELHREGRTFIAYRHVTNASGAAAQFVDLSPASNNARLPRIATAGTHVWVVWQDGRGEQPHRSDIYARHSTDEGVTWEKETRVSDSTGRAIQPALALLEESCPVIAWADNSSGAFDIHAHALCKESGLSNLSALGKTSSAGNSVDARSPRFPASLFPSIAVTRAGKIIIAWQDNRFDPDPLWTGHTPDTDVPNAGTDPDNWEILASTRDVNASAWAAPMRVSANEDAADRHPSVAVDGSGRIAIVWETQALQSSGASVSIRASQSKDEGHTWSAAQPVSLAPFAMSERPRLGVDPDGTLRVVWYDSRGSDWRWQIFTSRLEPSMSWSPARQITTLGNSTWPAISQGVLVFTSDRRAESAQRNPTQEVFRVRLTARASVDAQSHPY